MKLWLGRSLLDREKVQRALMLPYLFPFARFRTAVNCLHAGQVKPEPGAIDR